MIKVVMIARSTLYKVPGGDTIQIMQTAKELESIGVSVVVKLAIEKIDYNQYDLLHFFNIIRPADILYHIKKTDKPFVVSPILVDYSEFDKFHRRGVGGVLFRFLTADTIEFIKILGRWISGRDELMGLAYLWLGQCRAIKLILKKTQLLLPNSHLEYSRIQKLYKSNNNDVIVPNGIDPLMFQFDETVKKDKRMVICVARIEGIKNQLNLIRALNNTHYNLFIIGSPAPNQLSYFRKCKQIAKDNISFIKHLPQKELKIYYQKAYVHTLPSWFETTGLSSLEAAAMGCNIVITDKGDAKEYFGEYAFYCDPSSPRDIFKTIENAASHESYKALQDKIITQYTWQQAAIQTRKGYEQALEGN